MLGKIADPTQGPHAVDESESQELQRESALMDTGVGFGLAAFAAGLGLLAVLDRIGVPDRLLRLLVLALTIAGFLAAAAIRRTTRPAYFYAAGGVLPPRYSGLAAAALAAGLFFCLLPITTSDARLSSLTLGFGVGLVCAFFGTGALLRRSASFSVADLIATRFPQLSKSMIIAIIAAVCAFLVAFAGYDLALRGLISATGLGRGLAASLLGAILCFLVVAGGLSTVVWVAVEAVVILILGLALPLVFDLVNAHPLALPVIGDAALWASAKTSLAVTVGQPRADHVSTFSLIVTFAMGLATLTPLLGPTIASGRDRSFARTGVVAFAWLGLLGIFVGATLAASILTLDEAVVGQAPADVPAAILAANSKGRVTLCGGVAADPVALSRDCAKQQGFSGRLRLSDIRVLPEFLLEGMVKLRQVGPVIGGLADCFLVGLGLTLAAAGFQSFVTSLGHDAIAPDRRRRVSTSLRLAVTRLLAISSIAAAGILLTFRAVDTGTLTTLALFISAASLAPILGLLLWPRANSLDAAVTLLVTLFLVIGLVFSHGRVTAPTDLAPFILLAGVSGLMAGLFSSLLRGETAKSPAPPASGRAAPRELPPPDRANPA